MREDLDPATGFWLYSVRLLVMLSSNYSAAEKPPTLQCNPTTKLSDFLGLDAGMLSCMSPVLALLHLVPLSDDS